VAVSSAKAQCFSSIVDVNTDGTYYLLNLTSAAQCASFPLNTAVLLNGELYNVADCADSDGDGVYSVEVSHNGSTPVVLVTNAPVTISVGMNNCRYNSMGQLIALPIELRSFTGKSVDNRNTLNWETVNEVSNRGFEVQRLGADNEWLTLDFIKSKGAYGTYTYTDVAPATVSNYRLNQLDNDGKNTYSKVVTLQANGKTKFKIYPSVSAGVLTIENAKSFEIVNLLGQVVLSQTTPIPHSPFSIFNSPNGIYVVRGVDTEGGVFAQKIVKQ
jgi:hypothetical protein